MKMRIRLFCIIFLAPACLIYIFFFILPVIMSFFYSLTDWDAVSTKTIVWFNNYIEMLHENDYWRVVGNTATLVITSVIFQVPLGLILAYLLFNMKKGFKFFRTVYFLPVVIAPIAIGLMFTLFFNSQIGPVNKLLEAVGLPFLKRQWLSDVKVVLWSVIIPQVWQYIGLHFIILLAALRTIPEEIFESASIDGASPLRKFFSMVVPLIWDVIQICVILTVTGSLQAFDHAWVLTQGGPGIASSYIAIYMFKTAFISNYFGYGSAVTITILLYSLAFTVIFKKYGSRDTIQY